MAKRSVTRRENAVEKRANQAEELGEKNAQLISLKPVSEDFEGYALNFFFSKYICVSEEPDVQRGFLGCLYPIWLQSESTSPLKAAVAAVGFWMLESWSLLLRPGQPSSLSQFHYQKSVAALRHRLLSDDEVGDDIILTTLMLDMYENVQSFSAGRVNRGPHVKGSIALLERSQKVPSTRPKSPNLLLAARQHIINRLLSSKEPVSVDALALARFVDNAPRTPGNRQDDLNIQVADLSYRAAQLDQSDLAGRATVLELIQQATELDQQMLAWEESTPPDWTPIRVSGDDCIPSHVRTIGLYQAHCDIYKSIFVAERFNTHRFARIRVQIIILKCLDRLNNPSSPTAATAAAATASLNIIQTLADDFCASVPYHVGDRTSFARIDDKTTQYPHLPGCRQVSDDHHATAAAFAGFLLTRRLGELLSLETPLRAGQKQWAGGQLRRIKSVYNVVSPPEM